MSSFNLTFAGIEGIVICQRNENGSFTVAQTVELADDLMLEVVSHNGKLWLHCTAK